ncbi:SDR family NAD(P)-dependent oxidoreductase [Salinimicrobium gaetbulicola]|uniref:SDR family NAD(P)-dependent oxidoreductase n=1 Tax=Salinimicrobium gaetbulicola TaxID=999702 RepID=A0ABW3IC68_9FLAO
MKKKILIIGGSHGIGLETTRLLAKDHDIYVGARTKENLVNIDCNYFNFDVLKDDIASVGLPDSLDGFVYCPGSINLRPFKMLKPEDFQKELELNFLSLVRILQGILTKLKSGEKASLVFFSTVAVKVGMPFHTSISAAKGAIEGFARSLAAEYAPTLRVNVIAPSLTDTRLAEKLVSNESKRSVIEERHPLKRIGEASDIANLVEYLISDKSSWMTGQTIGMDGGLSSLNLN